MAYLVKIIGAAEETPHDGRWLVEWNSDTRYGSLHCTSTAEKAHAKRYDRAADALAEWGTVSSVEPTRPDGRPNRPLSALTIELEAVDV